MSSFLQTPVARSLDPRTDLGATMADVAVPAVRLAPRPVADDVDELLAGATRLGRYATAETRSTANFERVEVDGRPCVVKYVHPDHDAFARISGDLGCRPLRVWATGLVDVADDVIDHATVGVARWGRNGWGAAILMRDLADELVPAGDAPLDDAQHARFLDHMAAMAAATWGWRDDLGLLVPGARWSFFAPAHQVAEEAMGFPEPVPRLALEGWGRFRALAPADVVEAVDELLVDASPLTDALAATPTCLLHGDWKLANLGTASDGRTTLIDWAYPGEGPVAHELAWYLSLNQARLPQGTTKEDAIEVFRVALERRGVATDGWWDRQLDLALLGALVQFGWEKALGTGEVAAAELGWWCDAARAGLRRI